MSEKAEKVKTDTDKVLEMIEKEYGKSILISGQSVIDKEYKIIPMSPALNLGLKGGVPEGSWITLAGKPKCGKSMTALHFASQCQKPEYGGRHVYYLNVEGRLKKMNLEGTHGLNLDKFTIIESTEDKIMSAQDFLGAAEKILYNHPKCLLIIDSYSSLCHEKEITDGIGTSTRGGGAALLAQFTRQMSNVVPIKKSIVLGMTHLMANTSGYGAAVMEKGGNAIAYQVDVKLRCKGIEYFQNSAGKNVGQKITWLIECSALGAAPGDEVVSYLRYGYGIDEISEGIELGTSLGLIEKAGAWLTCDYMKNHLDVLGIKEWNKDTKKICLAQGQEKMYQLLKDNPVWVDILDKELQKLL